MSTIPGDKTITHYIAVVKQLTADNNHSKAALKVAEYLYKEEHESQYNKELVDMLSAICVIQNYFGEMPGGLSSVRDRLLQTALSRLSVADRNAFKEAL